MAHYSQLDMLTRYHSADFAALKNFLGSPEFFLKHSHENKRIKRKRSYRVGLNRKNILKKSAFTFIYFFKKL